MTATTEPAVTDHPLDLVHQACTGRTEDERHQFQNYLIGALTAAMPVNEVARAITAAEQCCRRASQRS